MAFIVLVFCTFSAIGKEPTYVPQAIDLTVEKLPKNYKGVNKSEFYWLFESRVRELKRGKFETIAEFEERSSNVDKLLKPIKPSSFYAFKVNGIYVVYDPDIQSYKFSSGNDWCESTNDTLVACKIEEIRRSSNNGIGTNAFGAITGLKTVRGRDLSLAIEPSGDSFNKYFKPDKYYRTKFGYSDILPMSIEDAKLIGNKEIGILMVGRVKEAKFAKADNYYSKATFDSPVETFIFNEAIPFDLEQIIYYVIPTGQMLVRHEFH